MSEPNDTLPGEEWRAVPGYKGLYEVSSHGRVRSLTAMVRGPHGSQQCRPGAILTPNYAGPYPTVGLCREAKKRRFRLHTLVLMAFVGPRPRGLVARHFPDRSVLNNRLDNLQWGTQAENTDDKEVHGTLTWGEANGMAKLTAEQVLKVVEMCQSGHSQAHVASVFHVGQQAVGKIMTGRRWRSVTGIGA